MQYFVVAQDGSKYGPADFLMINQWAQQGRILPHTILEEVGTGRQFNAAQLSGLAIPNQNAYVSPYQQSPKDYPRIVDSQADKMANWAKAMGWCGLFLCPIFSLIGIFIGIAAHAQGSLKARSAIITCVVTLLVYIVGYAVIMAAASSIMNGM